MESAQKNGCSYTASFKLRVVEFAGKNGNRKAEKKFGVNEKVVSTERSSLVIAQNVKDDESWKGATAGTKALLLGKS